VILVALPATALAVASLAAFFGRYVWWLDLLANFRVQYLVVLVTLGTILLFSSRYRKVGYGVLFVAGINLFLVAPLFVGGSGGEEINAPTIRVMSFNLQSQNEEYAAVVNFIDENQPDVVLLHEASLPWEAAMESASLGYEVVRVRSDDLIFGTLVMLKHPARITSFGFGTYDARAVEIAYRPDDWPEDILILSSHPLSPSDGDRAGLRDQQLGFAADWASRQDGSYMVVGDFNATPWSWPFRRLIEKGSLNNSQDGFGVQATFAANSNWLFRVPIDHLLHSDSLRVRDRRLGPALGSDHFPIVVDLEFVAG
jgi:endonuclease/exonuclease/phosphatase (EEP) superfamily protein YafD